MPSKQKKVSTTTPTELKNRIEVLESTVSRLERELEKSARPKQGTATSFFRQLAIVFLVLLCSVSSLLSVSSIWVKRNVIHTDVWVNKTSELVQDPAIRNTISTTIADQIFTQADVENQIQQILPDRISSLSSTLSDNLKTVVTNKIDEAIASDAFTETWAKANRSAHAGIIDSIRNGGNASDSLKQTAIMYVDDQHLVLNLRPVFAEVQSRLVSNGLGFIGTINVDKIGGQINLVTIQHMPLVLLAINIIDKAAFYLPILVILSGAGAIALSRNRRRTLMAIGWSVAILMVLLVQLVNIIRYPLIDAVANAETNAALAAYTIISDDLIMVGQMFLVIALLLVLAGFLSGQSKPARYLKDRLGKLLRVNSNQPAFRWIRDNTGYTLAGISIVAALLLVFPLVRGTTVYSITVVSTAVLLSLVVATIQQAKPPTQAKRKYSK